jgi:hypothetical protein
LAEHRPHMPGVTGSSPVSSTIRIHNRRGDSEHDSPPRRFSVCGRMGRELVAVGHRTARGSGESGSVVASALWARARLMNAHEEAGLTVLLPSLQGAPQGECSMAKRKHKPERDRRLHTSHRETFEEKAERPPDPSPSEHRLHQIASRRRFFDAPAGVSNGCCCNP